MELNPLKWSKLWRRAFLITLPVSGPLLLLVTVVYVLGVMILLIVLFIFVMPIQWIVEMWTGKCPIEWA